MAGVSKKDKKKKRKFDYYDAFEAQAEVALKEAKLLKEVVNGYSAEELEENLARAHALEREGDGLCHGVFDALLPDFVTPIDREDIIALAESLDEITDRIEEVMQAFYLYDIHTMREEIKPFAKVIVRSCDALCLAMEDFRNCKKSNKFKSLIVQVNDLEDEADELYMKLMRELYTAKVENHSFVMIWSNILNSMEDCVDQCELVANKMNMIMVKYA